MRIQVNLPQSADYDLIKTLDNIVRDLNGINEGKISVRHSATTAVPTTGTYKNGDVILHSSPVEAGSIGSKYVITGFMCVVSGTPGTWVQTRILTGN